MGLFNFVREIGKKIFGSEAEETVKEFEPHQWYNIKHYPIDIKRINDRQEL